MAEKFLIENTFVSSDRIKHILNPFNNEPAGEVFEAGEKEFNRSADYLTKIFHDYKKIPSYKKSELLNKVSEKLKQDKEEIALLITKETGKPIKFSRVEIDRAVLTFRLGAEETHRISGEIMPLDLLPGSEGKQGLIKRFPIGLILGITPWNFPINLIAHKVSPALASGNVIMIKPSSSSMLCGIALANLIYESCKETGLDICPMNFLTLSGSSLDKHINDERIKMISFTGSSDVGWRIKSKCVKQKVSLELGGNAGVIIDETEDLEGTINKLIIGGFNSAGQSCISVQRIYVNENMYDEFREKFVNKVKQIKFGDPFNEDTISGPMITEDEAKRAEEWLNEATNEGAVNLTNGNRYGAVLAPSVIENASDNMKIKNWEIFAPVVTIEKYSSFEEAVKKVNNSRFGLQAGIFTNDLKKVMYAFDNIETGGVIINDVSAYRMDSMPYGGVKDSGNSREGVRWAIREMTEEKILVM